MRYLPAALLVIFATSTAIAQPTTVSYQGELLKDMNPYTGNAEFKFAIVSAGGTLWSNDGTSSGGSEPTASVSLAVDAGFFSVLLGDAGLSMVPITSQVLGDDADPQLRVWVDTGGGFEQLPDQPLSSAAYAVVSDFSLAPWYLLERPVPGPSDDEWALQNPIGSGDMVHVGNGYVKVFNEFEIRTGNGSSVAMKFIGDTGRVGIGTETPATALDVVGTTSTSVLQINGGSDLAEPFSMRDGDQALPGMVVSIDPENPGGLEVSCEAYDRKVAGVLSGAGGLGPGMVMRAEGVPEADGSHNLALTGRVWCLADASSRSIAPGDLLTTAPRRGHVMRVTDHARAQGAVVGKAMTALDKGRGLVLVLVNLQ